MRDDPGFLPQAKRRLWTLATACGLTLFGVGAAQAQTTYYVDTNGNDSFDGRSATFITGTNGPVRTIGRAVERASSGDIISIEAGVYAAEASPLVIPKNLQLVIVPGGAGFSVADVRSGLTVAGNVSIGGAGTMSITGGLTLTSGTLSGSTRLSLPAAVTITRAGGALSGVPVFTDARTRLVYTGSANMTAGDEMQAGLTGGRVDVALANGRSLMLPAAGLSLGSGTVVNVGTGNSLSGMLRVTGMGVELNGAGTYGDIDVAGTAMMPQSRRAGRILVNSGSLAVAQPFTADDIDVAGGAATFAGDLVVPDLSQTGGQTTLGANLSATQVTIDGASSSFTFSGTLTLTGSFRRLAGTLSSAAGTIHFIGNGDARLDGGPNFTLRNLHVGRPREQKMLAIGQDIELVHDLRVETASRADVGSRIIRMTGGAGTSTVDGVIDALDNGGIVIEAPSTLTGGGDYTSITVLTAMGADATVNGRVRFTRLLALERGGFVIPAGSSLSPKEVGARVRVNLTGANTRILGLFNPEHMKYALEYTGNLNGGVYATNSEFITKDLTDLTISALDGVIDAGLLEDGAISGNVIVRNGENPAKPLLQTVTLRLPPAGIVVYGSISVEQNATIDVPNGGTLRITNATNTVNGHVGGQGTIQIQNGVAVRGMGRMGGPAAGSLFSGSALAEASEDTPVDRGAEALDVSTLDATLLRGLIIVDTRSDVTLAVAHVLGNLIVRAHADLELGTSRIDGDIEMNGTRLTLSVPVDVYGNVEANDGHMDFATFPLHLRGVDRRFVSNTSPNVQFVGTTGYLSFASTGQSLWLADKQLPGLEYQQSFLLVEDVRVNGLLRQTAANATVNGNRTLRHSGTAEIAGGDFFASTGPLRVNGTTMTLSGNASATTVTMDGNLTLRAPGTASLTLRTALNQTTGTLALNEHPVLFTGTGRVYDYAAGTVTGPGAFTFAGSAAQTYRLAAGLTIPHVVMNGVSATGSGARLTVGTHLTLTMGALTGDIALANNLVYTRWAGVLGNVPAYTTATPNGIDAIFGARGAMWDGSIDIGTDPRRVEHLFVWDTVRHCGALDVDVRAHVSNAISAQPRPVPCNTAPTVTMASGAELVMNDAGDFVAGVALQGANYDLTYRDFVRATVTPREFLTTVRTLTVDQDSMINPATIDALTMQSGLARAVDSLSVARGRFYLNGNTGATAFGTRSARIPASAMLSGGSPSDLEGYGQLRFTNARTGTARDGVFLVQNDGDGDWDVPYFMDIVVDMATPATRVHLRGGALDFANDYELLVLNRGILVAGTSANENTVFVRLDHLRRVAMRQGDNGQGFILSDPLFPQAHVAGNVRKRISSNDCSIAQNCRPGRVTFPLGSDTGQYGGLTFDFESNPQASEQIFGERELRASYVAASPGGTNGLPIIDPSMPGQTINGYPNFHWSVSSYPVLGAQTRFNLEAQAGAYRMEANEAVQSLRLIRRQSGDEMRNAYTVAGIGHDHFLADPTPAETGNGDAYPTLVSTDAQALLGPQATLFTVGTTRPSTARVATIQLIHSASVSPATMDVYMDGRLAYDDLRRDGSTPFLAIDNVSGARSVRVDLAPGASTSSHDAFRTLSVNVTGGSSYVAALVDQTSDQGTQVGLTLVPTSRAPRGDQRVELFAINGVQGSGPLDVRFQGGDAIASGIGYGFAGEPTTFQGSMLRIAVMAPGTTAPLLTARFDVASMVGQRGVLLVTGTRAALSAVLVRSDGSLLQGVVTTAGESMALPTAFDVRGPFPNPVRDRAALRLDLPVAAAVNVDVFDMLGRRVMHVENSSLAPGAGTALDLETAALAPGTYVYRLTARTAGEVFTRTGQFVRLP